MSIVALEARKYTRTHTSAHCVVRRSNSSHFIEFNTLIVLNEKNVSGPLDNWMYAKTAASLKPVLMSNPRSLESDLTQTAS